METKVCKKASETLSNVRKYFLFPYSPCVRMSVCVYVCSVCLCSYYVNAYGIKKIRRSTMNTDNMSIFIHLLHSELNLQNIIGELRVTLKYTEIFYGRYTIDVSRCTHRMRKIVIELFEY